jgi:hypothetical protein
MAIVLIDTDNDLTLETFGGDTNEDFDKVSDERIAEMVNSGKYEDIFDVFKSPQHMANAWNIEEIFYPSHSYMRIISNKLIKRYNLM